MIVWMNGAFGAGKTQAAFEVVRRQPALTLSDPEELGFGLLRMLPKELRADFQDFPAWRAGVVQALSRIDDSGRDVIAPMTLIEHHDEVIGQHLVHQMMLNVDPAGQASIELPDELFTPRRRAQGSVIAVGLDATIVTHDTGMAVAAASLGYPVLDPVIET